MIYVLQHSYKTEYNNFSDEIQGRIEYLYDIFKTYFIIKHTDYSIDNFLHPNYYILENFPSNIWEKYYFIVGDTDFVIRYIKSSDICLYLPELYYIIYLNILLLAHYYDFENIYEL